MKTIVLRTLSLAAAALLTAPVHAVDEKPEKPARVYLEDIIFDAKYLKQVLGPKTLVAPAEGSKEIPVKAIADARLDEKTQIFALPDDATRPQLISSIPVNFPQSTKLRREAPRADFFMFIGTDGNVKCLYCYNNNDQPFAILTADTLIKWRYVPAKINGTPVPVILPVEMKWEESAAALGVANGPKLPPSVKGNPTAPTPVRPGARNAPR